MQNYSLKAGTSLKLNALCYIVLVIYWYLYVLVEHNNVSFPARVKEIIIMELSSKILNVLCILKVQGEKIGCVEEPSLAKVLL